MDKEIVIKNYAFAKIVGVVNGSTLEWEVTINGKRAESGTQEIDGDAPKHLKEAEKAVVAEIKAKFDIAFAAVKGKVDWLNEIPVAKQYVIAAKTALATKEQEKVQIKEVIDNLVEEVMK